jgi:hypothetical protein
MAERFHGHVSCAVGTAKGLLNLISAATVRPRIYDILLGCKATPADLATQFTVIRTTAVGTENDGFTPTNLDPDGPASLCDFGRGAFSIEPTKTANSELLALSMNQRASVRWVAAPGSELIAPATANNGLCLQSAASTGTTAHEGAILFEE